jgi:hypothetical protein
MARCMVMETILPSYERLQGKVIAGELEVSLGFKFE